MDNTEIARTLIKEVEKYPILYDSGRPDFGNKSLKQDAWEAVCKAVITTWEECSIYEKVNSKRDIQKRWQAILQPFVKSLNSTSEGKKCDRQYLYEEDLQFVIPTLNRPKVVPEITVIEDKNNKTLNSSVRNVSTRITTRTYMQTLQPIRPKPDTSKIKVKRQCSPVLLKTASKNICLEDPLRAISTANSISSKPNTLAKDTVTLDFTSNSVNQSKIISSIETIPKMYVQVFQPIPSDKDTTPRPYEEVLIREDNNCEEDPLQPLEDDPDRMFFLSLLPSFRKIPAEHKLTVQLEVMQAIMKYTPPSTDGSPPPLSSISQTVIKPIGTSKTKNTTNPVKVEPNS